MKKVFYIALTAIAFAALLAGCAGGPKQQSDSPVSSTASAPPPAPKRTVNYTIIDWQGGALGRGVPEWVDLRIGQEQGCPFKNSWPERQGNVYLQRKGR
jgi:hypothetical protein